MTGHGFRQAETSADTTGTGRQVAADLVATAGAAGVTVATAESLTAGLLAATVAEIPGASAVLRGGLIVYATELKHDLAGVDATLLARRGPVDPEVAGQLARGTAQRCGADLGVGVTGVAGPDSQDGHPVGEVWIGVWSARLDAGVPRVAALDDRWQSAAGGTDEAVRSAVRRATVDQALEELLTAVGALQPGGACRE
ncbi:CinA family protein [Corynebacterium nuruki]|uniref:CinA family protein n=1 Tax=Corynebacterium nuruki TaxID=1032851 RepID=A0A3D4SVP3_9CORY|nr:CinA family protein [Corynebacterium nuruki]HCT13349.1 CinA family protein [Corynebacterium nuruki]